MNITVNALRNAHFLKRTLSCAQKKRWLFQSSAAFSAALASQCIPKSLEMPHAEFVMSESATGSMGCDIFCIFLRKVVD